MAIFDHFWPFFANYFSQNLDADSHFERLNVSKSQLDQIYDMNYKFFSQVCFLFWKNQTENFSFKNGHLLTICDHFYGNYIHIFHKTEIQTVI